MKRLFREWLGIDNLEYEVQNLKVEKIASKYGLKEAKAQQELEDVCGIVGGLLKHLDLQVRKKIVRDEMFLPPEPKMKEVYEIYKSNINCTCYLPHPNYTLIKDPKCPIHQTA